ncbi:carbohydrate ABC transporter permease [Inquilinus sp. CAU 1745]|uniref:carbohydrate ABC transporter permease n=1 Tax=Inquilinus sp. CAU 1745 TaxID=3140369 RepID=UPI00325A7F2D
MDKLFRLKTREQLAIQVLLVAYAFVVIAPLAVAFFNSFKELGQVYRDPFGLPDTLSWSNYVEAWTQASFGIYFRNSAIVAAASVFFTLFFGSMAAYVLARYEFRGSKLVFVLFLTGLAIPLRIAVIPLHVLMRELGLLDSLVGLVLVYVASSLPFAVFVLASFFRGINREIEDAARVDGATPFQIYRIVILPLIKPALATVGIFTFVSVWNDFFFPLIFITSDHLRTLPVGLSVFFSEFSIQWHLLFAGLIIMMLPTIVAFLLASRSFVQGLTMGAVNE